MVDLLLTTSKITATVGFLLLKSLQKSHNHPPISGTITPLNIMNDLIEFLCYA